MITQIDLQNVRLFEGPQTWHFPLSPLTVFCGTNSAGKSTILKSLLLLCQTQSAPEEGYRDGRLRLVGPLVDLGSFSSLVSHNENSRDITLGITVFDLLENRLLAPIRRARGPKSSGGRDTQHGYTLNVQFTFGVLKSERKTPVHDLPSVLSARDSTTTKTKQPFLKEAKFLFKSGDDIDLSWKVSLMIGSIEQGPYEYSMSIPTDYFTIAQGFNMIDASKEGSHVEVETFMRGLLPAGLWAKARTKKAQEPDQQDAWSYFPLPPLIRSVVTNLIQDFDRIHYLGPLRSPAKRYYMTNMDSVPGMDASGDFLPYVLRDQWDREIPYVSPRTRNKMIKGPLHQALNEWMHYIRTGDVHEDDQPLNEIGVTSMKDVLLEFTLRSFANEAHALADSGFGYSQVLPIVVRGLIAPAGSSIVVEQPELHLNPALQIRLAEFIASLVTARKRVLLETHSEHIVNAIRIQAAEEAGKTLAGSCVIYFLDTQSGRPQIRRLEIHSDGTVPDWPRSFFGEALSLSARLLKAQDKRRHIPTEKL